MPGSIRPVLLGAAAALLLLSVLAAFFLQRSLRQPAAWTAPSAPVAVISTRGSFDAEGRLLAGLDPRGYRLEGALPGYPGEGAGDGPSAAAPQDLLIVVHGFNNSADKAMFKFDLAAAGLRDCGYSGCTAGYSWDADRQKDPLAMTGYHAGRRVAVRNGPMLAQFILDYKARNPEARVHLVGYSMGARLVLEALRELAEAAPAQPWPAGAPLSTVHLVGAAVDNEEAELGENYGAAIQLACGRCYNYFSPEDDKLGAYYLPKEGDRALGELGIEHPAKAPGNYRDIDVTAELKSYTQSGELRAGEDGDNHSGYLGNRAPDGRLLDDGVMNLVAENLR